MAGKYSVKETREAFELGFALVQSARCAMADGNVTLGDIACVIPVFPYLESGITGLTLVPQELGELDADDEKELLDFARLRLPDVVTDDKLRNKVYAYVRAGLAIASALNA
jgi:hypothetical protein